MSGNKGVDVNGNVALVVILRRDPGELTAEEVSAIKAKFPDRSVTFRRTDPCNYQEHAAQCEEIKPAAVILPMDRHIPSLAMERGIVHVAFVDGDYRKLKQMEPEFEDFAAGG